MSYIEETLVLSKDCENESGSANFDDLSYSAANYHKLKLQLLESKMTALHGRINSMPIKRQPKVFGHAIHDSGRSSYLNVVVREHLDGHTGYLTQNDIRANRSRAENLDIREEFMSIRPKVQAGRMSMWESIKKRSGSKSRLPKRETNTSLCAKGSVQRKKPPKVIFGRRLKDNRRSVMENLAK